MPKEEAFLADIDKGDEETTELSEQIEGLEARGR